MQDNMASVMKREWRTKTGETKIGWRVQFLINGKKRFRQFPTERKAKKFVESVSELRRMGQKALLTGKTPTLATVASDWLSARQTGSDGEPPIEPETVVWYRGQLANHILPRLGKLPVGDVTRQMVREFRETILGDTSISRSTAKKVLVTLRSCLRYAVDTEQIDSDPATGMAVRSSSRSRQEVEIHSLEAMGKILTTAETLHRTAWQRRDSVSLLYYPMLLILVNCGLRISEVRGLDHKHIDFTHRVIRVRQRADRRGRLGAPKSAKGFREVHFPAQIEAVLRSAVERTPDGLVFGTVKSRRPMDPANFRKRGWEYVQKCAGVPILTLHSCRHFFASRQIADGINPKELAELMGHSDEAFTLRTYGHLFRDQDSINRRKARADALALIGS